MARIIGVEVPPNKRIEIALRYIYGIGPTNSREILARANIDPAIRAKDLTEQQLSQIVHAIQDGKYIHRRRSAPRNWHEPEAVAGYQVLSRRPPHARFAGAWSAHPDERSHAQRASKDSRRPTESERQDRHPLRIFI